MIAITSTHHEIAARYPYEISLLTSAPTSGVLVFQPRDGTRYVLLFSALSDLEARTLGHSPGSSLVSVMEDRPNAYITAAFSHAPFHAYVEEKLNVSPAKARQISRALKFLFEGTDVGPFVES